MEWKYCLRPKRTRKRRFQWAEEHIRFGTLPTGNSVLHFEFLDGTSFSFPFHSVWKWTSTCPDIPRDVQPIKFIRCSLDIWKSGRERSNPFLPAMFGSWTFSLTTFVIRSEISSGIYMMTILVLQIHVPQWWGTDGRWG